jgi:hypothetical protein
MRNAPITAYLIKIIEIVEKRAIYTPETHADWPLQRRSCCTGCREDA